MKYQAILLIVLILALPCAATAVTLAGVVVEKPYYRDRLAGALIQDAHVKIDLFGKQIVEMVGGRAEPSYAPNSIVFQSGGKLAPFGTLGTDIIFSDYVRNTGGLFKPHEAVLMQHIISSGETSSFIEEVRGLKLYMYFVKYVDSEGGQSFQLDVGRISSEKGYISFASRGSSVFLLDGQVGMTGGASLVRAIESVQRDCGDGTGGNILDLAAAILKSDGEDLRVNTPSGTHTPSPTILTLLNPRKIAACVQGRW